MDLFLYSLAILTGSVFLILLTARFRPISSGIFLASLITGSVLALIAAINVLTGRGIVTCHLNVSMPLGEFYIGIDSLSAFFLLAITVLFVAAGIFGMGYLPNNGHKKLAGHFSLYLVLLISLMLVVTSRNTVLFLLAWEIMSISSYFLITYDEGRQEVRKAGLLYLIATHTGTFCLWVMFVLLGQQAGSMNFDQMGAVQYPLSMAGFLFVLGVIGFGVKAGFIPLHIWLPHAHPAAPSHVSAVLSGVMIKMGIYGLIRLILIIKQFPDWCPAVLIVIGIISGVGGVLYALGQHEIKKLLAYHSVENIGIITLGLGMGLWGQIHQHYTVALIGYAGALLHVFNHAVFKGLLFLSAGAAIHKTYTGELDRLGGLLKCLPWTGYLFLIGSLSICGLPLFNGFISEWLVYRSLFEGLFKFHMEAIVFIGAAIIALSLIGALALMCFTKAFGSVFLGTSRSLNISHLEENSSIMVLPMAILALICLWIGIFPKVMVYSSLQAASNILPVQISALDVDGIVQPILLMVFALIVVVVITAVLALLKKTATKFLAVERAPTWACGYAYATPRMQYTASSFVNPILRIFRDVLFFHATGHKHKQIFPQKTHLTSHVIDASEAFLFRKIFQRIRQTSAQLKIIQCGFTQMYVLYIFLFLLFILIWKMR